MPRFEKREIHKVFLRFSNLALAKNLSPNLLAELCGVALELRGALRGQGGIAMRYSSEELEQRAVLDAAARMCAAARTAPKTKGEDRLETCVLTGGEKARLAAHMRELAAKFDYAFFLRDADNLDTADCVVLLGVREKRRGLGEGCGYCHFHGCADCAEHGGLCAFDAIDVGIAAGSAAAAAADARVDSRVMFSVGRTAQELGFLPDSTLILGIPVSVSAKSPFFDRKPKK